MKTKTVKLTENARRHIGESLTIRWGESRGRDTYGYTTCSLRNQRGERVAACNGGGYDMRGTVLGNWIASTFPKELCALTEKQMPEHSHWENERARVCDGACKEAWDTAMTDAVLNETKEADYPKQAKLPDDCFECPTCKGPTRASRDGKRVEDGRYFYGLSFYDPKYNVLNARLERCDGTFTNKDDVGKTFGELQKEGKLVDLDILRMWCKQTSNHSTLRHTVPTIDGACGESSVLQILNALGLCLEKVHDSKKLDIYIIRELTEAKG